MAGASLAEPLHGLVKSIFDRVDRDNLGMVQAADLLEGAFKAHGLVYTMHIPPRQVGFDPANRNGVGGSPADALVLASDIAMAGFSAAEAAHAICCEELPGSKSIEEFNRRLCEGSGLPPVEQDSIAYGSLACGHTNMALRAIAASVPSDCPLLSHAGHMSLEQLRTRDTTYATAVEQGLKWTVLKHAVRRDYPRALDIIQAARNMSGHIQRAETEVAGCVKLHRLASAFEHRGEKVDWDFIRRSVLRTRPPYADNLPGLIAFVAARSGGVDGPHLKYLQKWHGLTVTSSLRKQLPQGLYLTLSDFPFHYVALAIWQTAYTCPQEYLAFGLCKWISASDVGNLIRASNSPEQHAQVQLAEQALAYLRAKVPVAGFGPLHEESKLVTVFGKTDVAMGRMLLKRQAQSKVKHFSVADVLDYFVKEFTAVFPSKPTSAFVEGLPGYRTETPADPVASSSSEASGGLGLVRVSEEGVVLSGLALLRQRGLDVGTVLTQGTSGTHFRIERVLDATDSSTPESPRVVLQGLGDSKFERRSELVASVLADWRVASAKEVVETQSSWPAQRLCDLTDFKVLRFKGMILASLGALAELLDEKFRVHEAVVIYSKPARKVRAAQDFDKGALVLLPESANVKIAEQPGLRGVPPCGFDAQGAVHVCLEKTDTKDVGHLVLPGYNVTLAPATSDKALAPLWFVTTTPHADKANMTWEWFTIQELIGADHEGSGLLALPPAKRKRAHAKVSPELHDGVLQYNVKFPCLINAVALKEGDELICYKEAPIAKTKQGGAAITVAKLAKAAFEGPARK